MLRACVFRNKFNIGPCMQNYIAHGWPLPVSVWWLDRGIRARELLSPKFRDVINNRAAGMRQRTLAILLLSELMLLIRVSTRETSTRDYAKIAGHQFLQKPKTLISRSLDPFFNSTAETRKKLLGFLFRQERKCTLRKNLSRQFFTGNHVNMRIFFKRESKNLKFEWCWRIFERFLFLKKFSF